jgi:hypothetical protein
MTATESSNPVTYEIAGQTVAMPVVVRDASAGTAMFDVDAAAAQALLPGGDFTVVESAPGRTQLVLAIIDYRDNDLGDYNEVGVTLFVRPAGNPAGEGDGTFITHLPVDQEFTCAAGRGIWGFPKSVEQIDYEPGDGHTVATLRMDGRLALRLRVPRGGTDDMPIMDMTTYTYIDGVPHATAFGQGGAGSQVLVGGEGVELELGDHPLADQLRTLGLPDAPVVMATWTEHMQATFGVPRPLAPS